MLSVSFKFSKNDTPCNCADTKQNCVFLAFFQAFPSDLSCVSLLLRNKNYNYMNLKRQSICMYRLFGPSNIDFEDRNFGLPFA